MILVTVNLDIISQWIAVGFIVATAVVWALRKIKYSSKSKGGCGCTDGSKRKNDNCSKSHFSGCSGCPLSDNCSNDLSHK